MKHTSNENIYCRVNSVIILYALIFAFVVPTQILAKQVPDNSIFSKTKPERSNTSKTDKSFGNISVYFEENNGQFNSRVKYFARGTKGYSLFLTATEAVYVLKDSSEFRVQSSELEDENLVLNTKLQTPNSAKAVAVYMKLAGANENSSSVGLEQTPTGTNYFRGDDESKWRTNVPNFGQIQMNNVYQGIDAVWHGKENGSVQYDFVVKPNANPNQIKWDIAGADSIAIDEKGDLLIKTEFGEIRQQKPFTYQENSDGLKQEVESKFVIENQSQVKFQLGNYDSTKTLTIDPSVRLNQLAFSTFLGGAEDELGNGIVVDRAGNVYVTGESESDEFPTTPGTFDTTVNGSFDVTVTKLDATGSFLIYSTYIGGTSLNEGNAIAVDASGNAYLTGRTISSFPTTVGAFDTTPNGSADVYVLKLSPDGSSLVYSTLVGGAGNDIGNSIVIDAVGNAYVTGSSTSIPTTPGAFDETTNGQTDGFALKLNTDGSDLVYSTFLGGSATDIAHDIAIDSAGNAYVTGETFDSTTDYPTTVGSFDIIHNGNDDVFVTKLNASGSALVYSTFIGGTGNDEGRGIAVDATGNAFVTGETPSANYPTTFGAFQVAHGGLDDIFVTKLNSTGSTLIYSTYIGGTSEEKGLDIAINSAGNAFVTGQTFGSLPTTAGMFDSTHNGSLDGFAIKVHPQGSGLVYSTYLGGSGSERGRDIAVDTSGNIFVVGDSFEFSPADTYYPTTNDAFQTEHSGDNDIFVSKLGDYSISGRTLDTTGMPLANTSVGMSGDGSGFMLSDAGGYFYFGDTRLSGTNLISASQILYNFNPSNYEVFTSRNKQITFIGRPITSGPTAAFAALGGNVRSNVGNVGLANAKLTLIDAASGNATVVHSDANGDYEFESLLTGTFFLVVPEKEGYQFDPGIYQVNHLQQDLGRDFVATPNAPRPVNDFDGDGKSDLVVYRPNEGNWYILESESNNVKIIRFGLEGDIPVASDYDGDNRADIAVYRPSDGNWYRINSSNQQFEAIHFGISEDKPVQADFDGDGRTDLAVYRPSNGVWHRLMSDDGSYVATQFGISTDQPIAADYDSDGKADLTVYRDGTWYHQMSADNTVSIYQFGLENDKPIRGDFDGDGTIDSALFRPSSGVWYWIRSSDNNIQAKQFGISTDIPTPADYNGDGRYEQSVYRNGTWYVLRNDNSFYTTQFGQAGDVPVSEAR